MARDLLDRGFGKFEGSYPIDASDGRTIDWGGPLSRIAEAGNVVSTIPTDVGERRIGFDIAIQTPRRNFHTTNGSPR